MSTAIASPATYGLDASIPKFSVPRYQRMVDEGILAPDDAVELLENHLVLKMPRTPKHDGTIQRINKRLKAYLPAGWDLRPQSAITLSDSQPEPDFAVVREDPKDYTDRHPIATETGLVIEVAQSSLLRDRRDKTRIYARAGIPRYWIVNLEDDTLETYSRPTGPSDSPCYGDLLILPKSASVPLVLDGVLAATVPIVDLLA